MVKSRRPSARRIRWAVGPAVAGVLLLTACGGSTTESTEATVAAADPAVGSAAPSENADTPAPDAPSADADVDVSPADLTVGNCYPAATNDGYVPQTDPKPCGPDTTVKTLAVYDDLTLPMSVDAWDAVDETALGDLSAEERALFDATSEVLGTVFARCRGIVNDTVGLPALPDGGFRVSQFSADVVAASDEQWAAGDNRVACNIVKHEADSEALEPLPAELAGQGMVPGNQACYQFSDSDGRSPVPCPAVGTLDQTWMQFLRAVPFTVKKAPADDEAAANVIRAKCANVAKPFVAKKWRADLGKDVPVNISVENPAGAGAGTLAEAVMVPGATYNCSIPYGAWNGK